MSVSSSSNKAVHIIHRYYGKHLERPSSSDTQHTEKAAKTVFLLSSITSEKLFDNKTVNQNYWMDINKVCFILLYVSIIILCKHTGF